MKSLSFRALEERNERPKGITLGMPIWVRFVLLFLL
jgi:hypothetical protein